MAEVKEGGLLPESEAMRALASGEALVKIENETQMRIALEKPRDERKVLEGALKELELYPSAAEEAVYNKPVGRVPICPKCQAETRYQKACPKCGAPVPMAYARNLSIRAAESLLNRWGNNAWAAQILGEDENSVTIAAVFLDYENNNRRAVAKRVSKYRKRKYGHGMEKIADDKLSDLVIPANISKLLREVGLRALPAGLKQEYRRKAEKLCQATSAQAKKRMLEAFAGMGITAKQIEEHVGKPMADLSGKDIADLRGLYNALKSQEVSVEDVFGPQGKPTTESPVAEGAPKASELFGDSVPTNGELGKGGPKRKPRKRQS